MRKIYLLLTVIIAGMVIFTVLQFYESSAGDLRPEVLNVNTSGVTIAWFSESPDKGKVFYKSAGSNIKPLSVVETFGSSSQHEVVITGLKASTRYTYWIDNSENRFQFQTQPLPAGPFSFLVVAGDISGRSLPLLASEVPEFIISLTAIDKKSDPFLQVRPYIPIYGPDGADSPASGRGPRGYAAI